MPIGVIVAVAIVCVVVAALTSAQRADEVSLNHEQQLLQQTIVGRGLHVLRHLESAADTLQATNHLRVAYDPPWADRRIGRWLRDFYHHDAVVIVDGSDQIVYSLLRAPGAAGTADLQAQFTPILDLLRGRLTSLPPQTVALAPATDPRKPGRSAALIAGWD